MQRYFFHLDYGEYSADLEGTLLPGLAAARAAAVQYLGALLNEESDEFWEKPDVTVTVADEWGLNLFTVQVFGSQSPAAATALASGTL